jgi:hypothetical protein
MKSFDERILTQEISPEFARHELGNADEEQIYDRCEAAALRLERNYPVVAEVERNREYYGSDTGYRIRAIVTDDADLDEVQHGMQSVFYWLSSGD